MNQTKLLGSVILALALGLGSCAKSPEGFCESLAEDTCEVLATCCESGAKFDPDACRLDISNNCQKSLNLEQVHSGEVIFHSGAAGDCSGSIETCKDLDKLSADDSFEHLAVCGSVLTGFRPPGAACSKSSQCEPAGEFATCWDGGGSVGVCAAVVLDEEGCSFSFDDNELHTCPDGKYCDVFSFVAPATAPPTSRAFEFKASCKPNVGVGGSCRDKDDNILPCATGLYCDFSTGADAKCAKRKSSGADCFTSSECAEGLTCASSGGGGGTQTCQAPKTKGRYCFTPAKCGNGDCEPTETQASCPADCGGGSSNDCGDGFCDESMGESITCPDDCCGDGSCDLGEDSLCPDDCSAQ